MRIHERGDTCSRFVFQWEIGRIYKQGRLWKFVIIGMSQEGVPGQSHWEEPLLSDGQAAAEVIQSDNGNDDNQQNDVSDSSD